MSGSGYKRKIPRDQDRNSDSRDMAPVVGQKLFAEFLNGTEKASCGLCLECVQHRTNKRIYQGKKINFPDQISYIIVANIHWLIFVGGQAYKLRYQL